jgi:hypothetical protein
MSQEQLQKDIEWIYSICKCPEDLKILEPTAQTIGIINSLKNIEYSFEEIMKLSLMGILATQCRMTDEKRFNEIHPTAFLQVANAMLDPDDNGNNYSKLVEKIKK